MSFRQHPLECAKCFLRAFSLDDAKTRGFPCSASKLAAVASLWGNTSTKIFHWLVHSLSLPCCLISGRTGHAGSGWPPVPPGQPPSPYFGNPAAERGSAAQPGDTDAVACGDAPALAPSPGAAGVEVCSETKIIDLTRAGGSGPAHREVPQDCCFALLCYRELLIPAEGRNGIFSSWASCLHTLGAPQHGATIETLLAETRQLIGARDAPPWLQELPWGCCVAPRGLDCILATGCHPTYLPPVWGRGHGNTKLFHLSSPPVGEEQQSLASLSDVPRT